MGVKARILSAYPDILNENWGRAGPGHLHFPSIKSILAHLHIKDGLSTGSWLPCPVGVGVQYHWPTADWDPIVHQAMWAEDMPTPCRRCLQRSSLTGKHLQWGQGGKDRDPGPETELFDPEEKEFRRGPDFAF